MTDTEKLEFLAWMDRAAPVTMSNWKRMWLDERASRAALPGPAKREVEAVATKVAEHEAPDILDGSLPAQMDRSAARMAAFAKPIGRDDPDRTTQATRETSNVAQDPKVKKENNDEE